jgi:hypothetical protein
VAVSAETGATFRASAPKPLFQVHLGNTNLGGSRTEFVLSPDDQRIFVNQLLEESTRAPITVIINWAAELKEK